MIQTITTDVQFTAHFRGADERGDVVASSQQQGTMSALTPLAAMELYEQLHAKRNEVRRQAGLGEIATSDEGLVILAALRRFRDWGASPSLEAIAEVVCELVGQIERDRGGGPEDPLVLQMMNGQEPPPLTEDDMKAALAPSPPIWHCPSCYAMHETLKWGGGEGNLAAATCGACGTTHTYQKWLRETGRANGQVAAEVAG